MMYQKPGLQSILITLASLQSFNEVFKLYEEKHGKKTYISIEELKENIKGNPYDIVSFLQHDIAIGQGAVGSTTDNAKWPEWNPKPIEEFI
jgi:hypothetical protein